MTAKTFEISNYNDIQILLIALLEAKFAESPIERSISGSPVICRILEDLVDVITAWDTDQSGESARVRWRDWRRIDSSRREWKVALSRLDEVPAWRTWTIDEKERCARLLLSPFQPTSSALAEFIAEADLRIAEE